MTTLVVAATTHGSTLEIGERIADTLESMGVDALVRGVSEASQDLDSADRVVIGIPVYKQKLLHEGVAFLKSHAADLRDKEIIAFVTGGSPKLDDKLASVLREHGAHEVTYFRGAVDSTKLSTPEKLLLRLVKSPIDADWRDWEAIENWARDLAGNDTR